MLTSSICAIAFSDVIKKKNKCNIVLNESICTINFTCGDHFKYNRFFPGSLTTCNSVGFSLASAYTGQRDVCFGEAAADCNTRTLQILGHCRCQDLPDTRTFQIPGPYRYQDLPDTRTLQIPGPCRCRQMGCSTSKTFLDVNRPVIGHCT